MRVKPKNIIAFFLVLSLVLPNYASPTGDAAMYVPKEEFNSVFANFNERLSSFEAGINAKIDQQVSSYLDRYGIWNGLDQQVIPSTRFVYKGEEAYNNRYLCYTNPPNNFGSFPHESVFKTNVLESGDFIIPTKSGLLCLDVDTKGAYNTSSHTWVVDNRRTFNIIINNNTGVYYNSSQGFYCAIELFDYNTSELLMAIDLAEPYNIGAPDGWSWSGFNCVYKNFSGLYQFFVEKDKLVKWRLILKYNINGEPTSSFTIGAQYTSEWNMRFKSAIVY